MTNLGSIVGKPENEEEKTLCCFVLDSSGSMEGDPIKQLNEGVKQFYKEIGSSEVLKNQLEVAIIDFSSDVKTIREAGLLAPNEEPKQLIATGGTSLNEAVRQAVTLVETRKDELRSEEIDYKRPWIVLITDGAPTDGDVSGIEKMIEDDTMSKKYVFKPIAVNGADMQTLKRLEGCIPKTDGNKVISVKKSKTVKITDAEFLEFFKMLSKSFEGIVNAEVGQSGSSSDGITIDDLLDVD